MELSQVAYSVSGAIAHVTLHNPGRLNAVNLVMATELVRALETAAADPGVRVVLLSGAGKAFCAGGDVAWFAEELESGEFDVADLVHFYMRGTPLEVQALFGVNLQVLCLEVRAGRPMELALQTLADRVGVPEVRAFATLLQQSRELGSSLSDALRVFSEDMRHQRLAAAEEKAYALPAKLSVPVTACILPVVLFIAIWPVVVKFNS